MDDEIKMALERLEIITDEMHRIKRALKAAQDGVPFTEAWNEEVFLETKQEQKKGMSYLYRMIEHILKVKYCTKISLSNDRNRIHWRGEINTYRVKLFDITGWMSKKKKDTNLINFLADDIDDIYEVGVEYYKRDAEEYPDLKDGLSQIPEECPWTLEELLDKDIDYLLDKLNKNSIKEGV